MPERKKWWQSRKVWGTIAAAVIRMFGPRWGLDAETASDTALVLLGERQSRGSSTRFPRSVPVGRPKASWYILAQNERDIP